MDDIRNSNMGAIIDDLKLSGYKNRKIYIYDEIDSDIEFLVNYHLDILLENDILEGTQEPISIYISSPGGSVFSSLSIISKIEELQSLGYEINTYCHGIAFSGAFFIFIVGDNRYAQAHSRFMIHQPSIINMGSNSAEDIKRLSKDMDSVWDRLKMITKDYTNLDDDFLDNISKNNLDHHMWPEEAVELGVVDVIL